MQFPLPRPRDIGVYKNQHIHRYDAWITDDGEELIGTIPAADCAWCGDPTYRMPAVVQHYIDDLYGDWVYRWTCGKCVLQHSVTDYYFYSGSFNLPNINSLSEDELLDLYCELYHCMMYIRINLNHVQFQLMNVLNRLNCIRKL